MAAIARRDTLKEDSPMSPPQKNMALSLIKATRQVYKKKTGRVKVLLISFPFFNMESKNLTLKHPLTIAKNTFAFVRKSKPNTKKIQAKVMIDQSALFCLERALFSMEEGFASRN